MPPKFEVGEVVILQSDLLPHLNGEYTVHEIREPGYRDEFGGYFWRIDEYTYNLGFDFDHLEGRCRVFREKSLRKKHQPGGMSFRNLMQTLKDPSHA